MFWSFCAAERRAASDVAGKLRRSAEAPFVFCAPPPRRWLVCLSAVAAGVFYFLSQQSAAFAASLNIEVDFSQKQRFSIDFFQQGGRIFEYSNTYKVRDPRNVTTFREDIYFETGYILISYKIDGPMFDTTSNINVSIIAPGGFLSNRFDEFFVFGGQPRLSSKSGEPFRPISTVGFTELPSNLQVFEYNWAALIGTSVVQNEIGSSGGRFGFLSRIDLDARHPDIRLSDVSFDIDFKSGPSISRNFERIRFSMMAINGQVLVGDDVYIFDGTPPIATTSIVNVKPVPIPSAFPLFFSALLWLGFIGRRPA